ncbi:MAG TPA: MBL fold metallo-hydrolase [Terriglobales bacterium]|jgi:glyoxylase-like metal-dependent hydrolase (beta-lactamase superfamily II)
MGLRQITFAVGPLACNCTLLGDDAGRRAVVIDPGAEVDGIVQLLADHHWRLEAIYITHAHIDHIGGAAELKRRTGAPVWLNPRDHQLAGTLDLQAQWIGVPPPPQVTPDAALTGGARLELGGATLQVLETPGHTEGSVCLYLPGEHKLFAGDTLFAGSIGRTDLPGGSTPAILRSLHEVVLALPDDTQVIPGHGPETTIGRERATNPFLTGR